MVGNTAKDIRLCIDSRDSYQECFLEKNSEGINVVLGCGKHGILIEV